MTNSVERVYRRLQVERCQALPDEAGRVSAGSHRIGFGVGTRVRRQDMIVSPATEAQLGAGLGFFARQVLAEMCDRQQEIRLVAASATAV